MRGFVFIKYDGDDAGDVLDKILTDGPPGGSGLDDDDVHDVTSKTYRRIGFVPNDPDDDEDEDEGEPDEDDGTITY